MEEEVRKCFGAGGWGDDVEKCRERHDWVEVIPSPG